MQIRNIIVSICLGFSSLTIPLSFAKNSAVTSLASVSNPDGYDAPEGTSIKLYRQQHICIIQAIYFGETGKTIEKWTFNQFGLLSVHQLVIGYTNGGLAALSLNGGKFSEFIKKNQMLDVNYAQQQEFKKLRDLFPTKMVQCLIA